MTFKGPGADVAKKVLKLFPDAPQNPPSFKNMRVALQAAGVCDDTAEPQCRKAIVLHSDLCTAPVCVGVCCSVEAIAATCTMEDAESSGDNQPNRPATIQDMCQVETPDAEESWGGEMTFKGPGADVAKKVLKLFPDAPQNPPAFKNMRVALQAAGVCDDTAEPQCRKAIVLHSDLCTAPVGCPQMAAIEAIATKHKMVDCNIPGDCGNPRPV